MMIIAAIVIGIPSAGLLLYIGFKAGEAWSDVSWQAKVKPLLEAIDEWRDTKKAAEQWEPRREDQQP